MYTISIMILFIEKIIFYPHEHWNNEKKVPGDRWIKVCFIMNMNDGKLFEKSPERSHIIPVRFGDRPTCLLIRMSAVSMYIFSLPNIEIKCARFQTFLSKKPRKIARVYMFPLIKRQQFFWVVEHNGRRTKGKVWKGKKSCWWFSSI